MWGWVLRSNYNFKFFSVIGLCLVMVSGCLNQDAASTVVKKSSSSAASSGSVSSSSSQDSQCAVFANNSNDYSNCVACKQTYCSCAPTCTTTQVISCSMNINTLAQCVHNNTFASGGSCVGLVCGDGQVADFVSCSCKDAVPSSSYQPAPGTEDGGIARMQVGYSITNRYCPSSILDLDNSTPSTTRCTVDPGATALSTVFKNDGTPGWSNLPATNIYQDVGYVRWDLGLDASQYPMRRALYNKVPFLGSYSTIPLNLFFSYQLKPNTAIKSGTTSIKWTDCAEHFSATNSYVSNNTTCSDRTAGTVHAPPAAAIPLSIQSNAGSASVERISMNGSVANGNFVNFDITGNKKLNLTTSNLATVGAANYGLMKQESFGALGNQSPTTHGTGLASNIGNYKFTFGPLAVTNTKTGATISANNSVSGSIAMNVNLGYTPVSAVDSTAFSPDAFTNTLVGRDCSGYYTGDSSIGPQCVVTAVYRGAGGGVLSQSFSPRFQDGYHSSNVSSLPSGITAVSTPKVVEDISQDVSSIKKPARLRTFVRASDGNIYMSVYKNAKWYPWMSLGRPWICQSTECATYASSSVANSYKPLNLALTPLSTATFSSSANDGISIVSEPVVSAYMDHSQIPVAGYIVVAVRVSHINSSTGRGSDLHNAVFYNIAKASTAVSNDQYDFDNATNWSGWMPVYNGATYFKTFGNPIAILHGVTATPSQVGLHFIGQYTTSGVDYLHPPIAQPSTAVPPTVGTNQNYYNYANAIRTMSLRIDNIFPIPLVATYPAATNVTSVGLSGLPTSTLTDDDVINTDLTWTRFSNVAQLDKIRVFAGALTLSSSLSSAVAGKAPVDYTGRGLIHVNFSLSDTAATMDPDGCPNSYHNRASNFIGTPYAIDLARYDTAQNSPGKASQVAPTTQRLFVFGRTICPNDYGTNNFSSYCDTVNPTFGYITQRDSLTASCATNGANDVTQYFYGMSLTNSNPTIAASFTTTQYLNLQPFYTTSDVIPVLSNALFRGGYDVPVYLFMRSPNGILTHSFWGGKNLGTEGYPSFQVFSKGAFTN